MPLPSIQAGGSEMGPPSGELRRNISGVTEGVAPDSFRRTVAKLLDRAGGADLAAEMLGHTSARITKEQYIEPDEKVNPVTADILEALAPKVVRDDVR